jgi:hypothetical protein
MITYFKSLTTKIDDNKKPYTCTLQDHYKYHSLTSSKLTNTFIDSFSFAFGTKSIAKGFIPFVCSVIPLQLFKSFGGLFSFSTKR